MKKLFCGSCNKVVDIASFEYMDMDVEVVLKSNRLVTTGKAMAVSDFQSLVTLDSETKIEVNKALTEVLLTENINSEVVCPGCREGVLIAGKEILDAPKETKEERLRRLNFASGTPGTLGHLSAEHMLRQIQSLGGQVKEEKALSKDDIVTTFNIDRYYISKDCGVSWAEVSLSAYATAERNAGFMPDPMRGPIATTKFNQEGLLGKVIKFKGK